MAFYDNNRPQVPSPPVPSRNVFPSLIEFPTDKSTDITNTNNNDRLGNNNDNVVSFPCQDKQSVLP